MLVTERHRDELRQQGYSIIENVVTEKQCDIWVDEYKQWLSQFKGDDWPFTAHSLVQRYNIGNFDTTWNARLATKKVFSELWYTDKLLTSVDAIAVGRPPESSDEDFALPGQHWLHCDQNAQRKGLHSYQGGLYLEHTDTDDWTFHVLKGSHLYHAEFFDTNKKANLQSNINKYYHLKDADIEWFQSKGCNDIRVAVPKGAMILWDSRLIHANARPIEGRKNPGRWRFVVLVCMAPAIWATKEDLEKKKEAYSSLAMTTHWPCQGVNKMKSEIPSFCRHDVTIPNAHTTIIKTKTVKELCGVNPYNFHDGKCNGPELIPEWHNDIIISTKNKTGPLQSISHLVVFAISILVMIIAYQFAHKNES